MPRRTHLRPRARRQSPYQPPEPPPQLTPEQLAQRLVSRGLAAPIILEASEVYTPSRRHPDAPS